MSFKFALGAVIAVVAGAFMIPGIASAHEVSVNGTVTCEDGTFDIVADYHGGSGNRIVTVSVNGDSYDIDQGDIITNLGDNDANLPENQPAIDEDYTEGGQNLNTTLSGLLDLDTDSDVNDEESNFDVDRDRFAFDGHGGDLDSTDQLDAFFAVDGHFDDLDNNGGSVEVVARMYGATDESALNSPNLNDQNNPFIMSDSDEVDVGSFDGCVIDICLAGATGVETYEWVGGATGDCNAVNLCVNNVPTIVSEFTADQLGLVDDEDGCIPGDSAPPTITTISTEPEPEVEEVAEVSPAVDEVVALPSTGYGTTSGGIAWAAVAALAMIGIGGSVAVVARKS